MKSIKSKFIRGLSLLLALVVLLNIPISALASAVSEAAYVPTDDAIIQEMLGKGYDEDRAEMIAHDAFQALKYLGYDYDKYLENNGLLFTKGYYGSKLLTNAPDSLTEIAWTNNGNGMQTTSSKSPYSNADSYTGEYPDVTKFEKTGLDCADYVSYYYTNYLPNIAGVDVSVITDAMAYVMAKNNGMYGNDYSYMNFWDDAREYFVSQGVRVYQVTKSGSIDDEGDVTLDGNILEYIDHAGNKKTDNIFEDLPIGTLIQMGEMPGDDYNQDGQTTRLIHYAVYAGSWTDPSTGKTQHYIAHSSNKKRGPEISTLYNMSPEANGTNKSSVAMYFYVFTSSEEQYGSITIKKEGPKGESLAGAKFFLIHQETGQDWDMTTDNDGIASLGELPLGTYTVTEVEAPPGYIKSDKTWTFTLTKDDPTGGGTLTVVNEPNVGSLQILKEITPSSAAIPENLAGWQFKLYHNSPVKTATLNSSSANRSYRVTVTDKYGNSVSSAAGHMAIGPVITKQPADQFTANGSNFTFSVTATNAASYQWEYSANSGKTWSNWTSSASTSSTFTRAMSDTMRKYQFRCKITDSSGHVVYSDAVTPYHNTEFAITTQPQSQVSKVGSSASFTVGLSGSTSGATYQWQTSSNGGSSWSNVSTSATYTASKTSTSLLKENWIYDTSVRFLKVTPDNYTTMQTPGSFFNTHYGIGKIVKNTNTGENREGWIFEITDEDGNPVKDAFGNPIGLQTTDEKGMISLNLLPGTYLVTEVGPENDKWQLDKSTKTLVVEAGEIKTVSFLNIMYGSLDIVKKTTNGGTLVGWTFLIEDENNEVIGQYTTTAEDIITDANGENVAKISISILPGTYYITEIANDDAYWTVDKSIVVVDVESDATATATFVNKWAGKASILKVMTDGSSPAGWQFQVIGPDGKEIPGSPFTTDENGDIHINNLQPGDYIIEELIPMDCLYRPVGENPKTIKVRAGETASVAFENDLRPGKLMIEKVNETGDHLAGAKFLLEWSTDGINWSPVMYSSTIIPGGCRSEGLENGCLVTGEDGRIVFEGLHPDLEYRLTEIEAPNGYALQSAPVFEGKLPVDALSAEVDVLNYGIIELPPPTGIDAHLTGLTVFTAIVVCLFFAMVALAIKEGMLTEFIRKHRK